MDHILFLLADQWERLQVHLSSLFRTTQRLSIEAGGVINRETTRIWGQITQPGVVTRLWEAIQATLNRWLELVRNTGFRHIQDYVVRLINYPVTRAHVLIGSVGLALGGSVGFILGANWKAKLPYGPKIRAVGLNRYNGIQGVGMIEDLAMPHITSKDQVLINVRAASINAVDLKIPFGYGQVLRNHFSRYRKDSSLFPIVLGRDCVGVVVETGRGVTHVDVGDRVWSVAPYWDQGLMAEYIVLPESLVARVPPQLSLESASTIPYSAVVLWRALTQAHLNRNNTKGKRVLVLTADCGTGLLAIQVLKCWGAHVTTTCSPSHIPVIQRLGADDIIQYAQHTNFSKELDMRHKFDVIFNNVGIALTECCTHHCTGVVVNTLDLDIPSDSYNFVLRSLYSLWIRAKSLVSQRLVVDNGIGIEVLEEIRKMVHKGEIRAIVGRSFPAWDADLAFQHAASAPVLGKSVLSFSVRKEIAELLPKH